MFKIIFLISFFLFLTVYSANSHDESEEELLKRIERGFKELQVTRNFPIYLNDSLQKLQIPNVFQSADPADIDFKPNPNLKASSICSLCYTATNFLINERRNGVEVDVIALEAEAICTLLGIENGKVCNGVISLNLPIFTYIVDSNKNLKGERICDIILENSGCNSTTTDWGVKIDGVQTRNRKKSSGLGFNILHFSDFHYDPRYTNGSKADCDEPLCCQNDQGDGDVKKGTACGYWSEYQKADPSEALINETIRKASEFDFDYVYFTGDVVSHRVWSTSIESNTKSMKFVFSQMKSAFPNTPIYFILGNHEPTPLNEYAIGDVGKSLSTEWLYELVASEFSEWLTDEAKQDIRKGGYYTVSPKKGFRIIGLNSNVAYTMNWWLVQDDHDPLGQLEWLSKTLNDAEKNNEVVHILSHIPSGKNDLQRVWSREYNRIVERYFNTIGAQFNGHTHKDQFMVQFDSSRPSEVINIAINGASVICDEANPNFKILNVDSQSYDVIDTQVWTFNLTEANLNSTQTPNWYQLYSFKEAFGVKNLSPSSFTELIPRMATDHSLLEKYHQLRYRNSTVITNIPCNDSCKKNYLCEIVTSQVGENFQCEYFKDVYDRNK